MSNFGGLVCAACGAALELEVWYDGCDWHSKAGEGSGFNYSVTLSCTSCPRIYPVGRVKQLKDFCEDTDNAGTYQKLSKLQEGL